MTRGRRGARGARGLRGKTGHTGPQGPRLKRADVVAMVDDEFTQMKHALHLQLVRMGQIQVQLDAIHKVVKQLLEQGRHALSVAEFKA